MALNFLCWLNLLMVCARVKNYTYCKSKHAKIEATSIGSGITLEVKLINPFTSPLHKKTDE